MNCMVPMTLLFSFCAGLLKVNVKDSNLLFSLKKKLIFLNSS